MKQDKRRNKLVHLGSYFALQTIAFSNLKQSDEIRNLAAKYCNKEQNRRPLFQVQGFIAQTANVMLLIINASDHSEGIDAFTKDVAAISEGSEVFNGVELSNESSNMSQQETGISIFIFKGKSLDDFEQLVRVSNLSGVIRCIISPIEYEIRVICRADSAGAFYKESSGQNTAPPTTPIIFDYSWTEPAYPVEKRENRYRKYDAVWAQHNEALINTAVFLNNRVAKLEDFICTRDSQSRAIIDLRLPLATFRENLEMIIAGARDYEKQVSKPKLSMAGSLDVISNYVLYAEKQINVLEIFLEQRRSGLVNQNQVESCPSGAIMPLDGVAHYCGRVMEYTLGTIPQNRRQWAVLLGQYLRLIDAPEFRGVFHFDVSWLASDVFSRIKKSGGNIEKQGAQIGIIEFPRMWLFRSGSFPLIAWAISHDYSSGGWVDELKNEFQVEVEQESTKLRKDTGSSSRLTDLNIADIAKDLSYDLVSIYMLGPSYVYALARFGMLGKMGGLDWTGLTRYTGAISRDLIRLRINLRILKSLGLKVPFFSNAFSSIRKGLSGYNLKNILEQQGPIIRKRYEFSVREVMPSLIRGEVDEWEPDLILNALWYGVAERAKYGYVNEAAVFWSLIRWGVNRPEADLTDYT